MNDLADSTAHERPSGALHELVNDPGSRKRFLRMVGGTTAASALAILVSACGDEESKEGADQKREDRVGGQDPEIVRYALTLEHVEADFYDAVIESGVQVPSRRVAELIRTLRENEHQHVDALTGLAQRLGGRPKPPETNFDSVIEGGPNKILETAAELENVGAAAYLGQADRIGSKEVLASALAIHTVEARHAAALNRVVDAAFLPDGAFARAASIDEVLPRVQQFIVG